MLALIIHWGPSSPKVRPDSAVSPCHYTHSYFQPLSHKVKEHPSAFKLCPVLLLREGLGVCDGLTQSVELELSQSHETIV